MRRVNIKDACPPIKCNLCPSKSFFSICVF